MSRRVKPRKNNLTVYPRRNEDPLRMIKRFTKKIKKMGLIEEVKKKKRYQKPSEVRKEKKKKSIIARNKANKAQNR